MYRKDLNFHRGSDTGLRLLQVATLVAVVGAASTGALLLTGTGQRTLSANISDTLASPSFSELPVPSVSLSPVALSEQAVAGAGEGLRPGTVRYYEKATGRAFSVDLSTRKTDTLSDTKLPAFIGSLWIPRTSTVISSFQKGAGTEHRYYDYETGASSVIGSDISSVAVSRDGRTLAVVRSPTADSLRISISRPDGSDSRDLLSTRMTEPSLRWRTDSELSVVSRRSDRPGKDLSLLSVEGALRQILTNKENLDVAWSPDGRYLLYSFFAEEKGVSLWLMDATTGEAVSLGVPTSASKCAWFPTGLAIACGIPTQESLTRDVPVDYTASIDDVAVYDFDENSYRVVYEGASGALYGITEPFVTSSGNHFVFTNMFDTRLYTVPLE